jgi:hypothetical protein
MTGPGLRSSAKLKWILTNSNCITNKLIQANPFYSNLRLLSRRFPASSSLLVCEAPHDIYMIVGDLCFGFGILQIISNGKKESIYFTQSHCC